MYKLFIHTLFILVFYSCQTHQKFEKNKWAEAGDLLTFPHRRVMIDDLIKNTPLKGKKYQEIISLLGLPQNTIDSTMKIGYKINEAYGTGIDPIYTKTLILYFNKDSTVVSVITQEWEKK